MPHSDVTRNDSGLRIQGGSNYTPSQRQKYRPAVQCQLEPCDSINTSRYTVLASALPHPVGFANRAR